MRSNGLTRLTLAACISLLCAISCSYKPSRKDHWEVNYRKVNLFTGSTIIKIGTDSCYYESGETIHKNPSMIRWVADVRKLRALYKQIEKYNLQDGQQIMSSVMETPFETLELVKNGRVLFSLLKHQQYYAHEIRNFEGVVALLRSFSSTGQSW